MSFEDQEEDKKIPNQTAYWANQKTYELGIDHPHRQLILDELKKLEPFTKVLEVGCDIGQNLQRIHAVYPEVELSGYDINDTSIAKARKLLPKATFKIGKGLRWIPFAGKSDITIADAVLMYVGPKDIADVLRELVMVTKKAIIIVDWSSDDWKPGHPIRDGYSYVRDYEKMFMDPDRTLEIRSGRKVEKVEKIKITKDIWPTSEKWQKYGHCFIVHLQ